MGFAEFVRIYQKLTLRAHSASEENVLMSALWCSEIMGGLLWYFFFFCFISTENKGIQIIALQCLSAVALCYNGSL